MIRRRRFLTGCGALAGAVTIDRLRTSLSAGELEVRPGPRALLILEGRGALRASELLPHHSYVFAYPFESTPCFLLNLDRAVPGARLHVNGGRTVYDWAGGVGRDRSVVAFSAICPHAYTHPTREVAMVHYYGPETPATVAQRTGVVTCCVHGSTFDPGRGAAPLQPPAEIPLAGIVLEWDEATDALYARGVAGRPVFDEFFRSFPRYSHREVQGSTPVWPLDRYSRSVLSC